MDRLDIDKKIWMERYRPSTLDEMILPDRIKEQFASYIEKQDIPNLLFFSPGGMGKTSAAWVLIKALNMDYIEINGSLDTSVDNVRDKIVRFASTVSLLNNSQKKCIFITEADGFSNEAKNALKNLIEKFNDNIRLIFDTNYIEKIPQPLRSRCVEVDFNYDKKEYSIMMKNLLTRCVHILEENNITYDKKDIAELIKQRFPDMRKIMNDLQKGSLSGSFIKTQNSPEEQFNNLIDSLKTNNYDNIRNIVKDITDYDSTILRMYRVTEELVSRKYIPHYILILAEYQHKSLICLSKEINFLAMLTDILAKGIEFK